jgi:hypothetical protein
MPIVLCLGLLLGIFSEERVPAEGYACLSVRYRGVAYKAVKFERSRLTGVVTLTLRAPLDPLAALLGEKAAERVVELTGYEAVGDSNECACAPVHRLHGVCFDR